MYKKQTFQLKSGDKVNFRNENAEPVSLTIKTSLGTKMTADLGLGAGVKIVTGEEYLTFLINEPDEKWQGIKVVED